MSLFLFFLSDYFLFLFFLFSRLLVFILASKLILFLLKSLFLLSWKSTFFSSFLETILLLTLLVRKFSSQLILIDRLHRLRVKLTPMRFEERFPLRLETSPIFHLCTLSRLP